MASDFKLSPIDIVNNDILYYITKKYINMYRAEADFVSRLNNILSSLSITRYLHINDGNICLFKPQKLSTTSLMTFIKYLIYHRVIVNTVSCGFVVDLNFRFNYYGSNIRIIPSLTENNRTEYYLAEVYDCI